MNIISLLLGVIIGAVLGGGLVLFIFLLSKKKSDEDIQRVKEELEKTFKALSFDVANQSTEQLLRLAKEALDSKTSESSTELDNKKQLIDQSLSSLSKDLQERMEKVQKLMTEINQNVPEKYGQVSSAINNIAQQSENLRRTTETLRIALSGTQQRGQWGERIAEDIIKHIGLIENVHYKKQHQIENGKSRPDFTFLLPENLKINMDVKFPGSKYLEYYQADDEAQREAARKSFLSAVRARIKEVTTREYINSNDNTLDYVLVFIPNEQIYTFIYECDSTILDEALKQKVVLCSPLTLYAMLALIRQAIDNFNLRKSSNEIQSLLAGFSNQWKNFLKCMTDLGKKIDQTKDEYDEMVGKRQKMLDVQVKKIDQLSKAGGIEPKIVGDGDSVAEIESNDKNADDKLLL